MGQLKLETHEEYASRAFGVPVKEVTPEMRQYAKTVRYVELYSTSSRTLDVLETLKRKPEIAADMLARFKKSGVGAALDELAKNAEGQGKPGMG